MYDGNGFTLPSKPLLAGEPEGEYSTIRLADGSIETVLFNWQGKRIAGPVRTYQSITYIQREHIRTIQTELEGK